MDLIEKSLKIALDAYTGKKDKAGKTYILHPLRIMQKMESAELKAVAILHDVIEDSDYTADDLRSAGMPDEVVEAVVSLTRKEDESYSDFIDRASRNAFARDVKLADIEDNMDILRLEEIREKDLERLKKYHRAYRRLQK